MLVQKQRVLGIVVQTRTAEGVECIEQPVEPILGHDPRVMRPQVFDRCRFQVGLQRLSCASPGQVAVQRGQCERIPRRAEALDHTDTDRRDHRDMAKSLARMGV